MKISNAFVFYLCVFVICSTIALGFLYFKLIRHGWFSLINHFGIGKGKIFKMVFWVAFSIIAVILIDSIITYNQIK
jgi:hypothetical protein